MCKCVAMVNKNLAEYNTAIDQVSMVNFKTGKVRQSMTIATRKIERRKGKAKVLLPSFCPFCGTAIVETNAA